MTTYQSEGGWTGGSGLQEWEIAGEEESEGRRGWSEESHYEGESSGEGPFEFEFEGEGSDEREDEFEGRDESEAQLAQELLEISDEQELEEFLGKLVKGAGKFLKSGVGKAVTGVLRNVAKTALPMVGSALGSMVAPGLGTVIGGKLGSMASNLLEVDEAEMLGEVEAEYEAAQRFVRFGRATARYAAMAPANVPPQVAARSAAVTAARRYAPRLLRSSAPGWRTRRATRNQGRGRSYQPDRYPPRRRPVRRPWSAYGQLPVPYDYAPWAVAWPPGSGYGYSDDDGNDGRNDGGYDGGYDGGFDGRGGSDSDGAEGFEFP